MCLMVCPGEPYRYAKALGISIENVTVALAIADDLTPMAVAYRARGASPTRLISARRSIGGASRAASAGLLTELDVDGRSIAFVRYSSALEGGEYLVTVGDALVILFGSPPTKEGVVPKYIAQEVEALPR